MSNNLTIALLGRYFGWGGGVDFLRHIANGLLARQQAHNLKIFLLLPKDNKIETPVDFLHVVKRSIKGSIQRKRPWLALPTSAFHESVPDFFLHTQGERIEIVYHESSTAGLLRCLRRIKADVALPVNGTLGQNCLVPWLGYVPDFQHKYLKENFSSDECILRDIQFANIFRDATAAVVNSKAVKDDILKFSPNTKTKIYSLPFSPNPVPEWFDELEYDVREKYSLPDKFFMISNQFWIHKDHLTAFKAMISVDVNIVCTGTMGDYRRPEYMDEINQFLDTNNLTKRVKLLGHISKRDQVEIMKKSIAVVQPTLFEGGPGGGCVYDAASLGVPVIMSDISVNMEVEAENIWYFKAGSSDDLAEKMRDFLQMEVSRPCKDRLLKMGQRNLEKLGDSLLEAVNCVTRK